MKAEYYSPGFICNCGVPMFVHDPRICPCEDKRKFLCCSNKDCELFNERFEVPSIELSRLA